LPKIPENLLAGEFKRPIAEEFADAQSHSVNQRGITK
jgi:hypothetical protein